MGVAIELENFDELYKSMTREPIIINFISESSREDRERLENLIQTSYSNVTDLLNNIPSCECGETYGGFNGPSGNSPGVICKICRTEVKPPMEQKLEPILWFKSPVGVAKLINPMVWNMLADRFTKGGFNIVRWLCDTSYQPIVKVPKVLEEVQALGIPRGYNHFVQHFHAILEALFNIKQLQKKRAGFEKHFEPLREVLQLYPDCIFSEYLPIPNRALLVIEETTTGTYVDQLVVEMKDAILTMSSIDSPLSTHSIRVKENRTIRSIDVSAKCYRGQFQATFAGKPGTFRKHVYGSRAHFSWRSVISSKTDCHRYDEIELPWGVAVSLFRIHLSNKLSKRGMTPNQILAFLYEHSAKYHPLLDELFKELIAEAPNQKISAVFQRNPSLERASAQRFFITKVKTDPGDPTTSLPILSTVGFNADQVHLVCVRVTPV